MLMSFPLRQNGNLVATMKFRSHAENVRLGLRAKGRKVSEAGEGFQLREDAEIHIADFDFKNCNMERYSTFSAGNNFVYTNL